MVFCLFHIYILSLRYGKTRIDGYFTALLTFVFLFEVWIFRLFYFSFILVQVNEYFISYLSCFQIPPAHSSKSKGAFVLLFIIRTYINVMYSEYKGCKRLKLVTLKAKVLQK